MVSAMKPGLAKIIEKVHSSRYIENSETDHHIGANAACVNYVDTGSLEWVHWLSKCRSTNCSPTYYGWEIMVEFDTAVTWASLPITRIHLRVAEESKRLWLPVTLHNSGWMDNCQVRHGSFRAIPILDSVDVEKAFGHPASWYHWL